MAEWVERETFLLTDLVGSTANSDAWAPSSTRGMESVDLAALAQDQRTTA